MPETIAHRDLRNRSSEILRRVQDGETFQITNHGEVVAVLVPPQDVVLGGLRCRRATASGGFSSLPRHHLETSAQAVLDELRGER